MPDRTNGQLVTRYAVRTLRAVRVVLVAAIIVLVLIYVVTVAGWEVVALAE